MRIMKKKYSDIVKMLIPTKKIWRGLKNASYLTIAHFSSMIINFFGFILIARLLGPSNYGIYVTVAAFIGLFWILTFNGLHKVILREGSKDFNQMGDYLEKTIGIKIFFTFIAINFSIIFSSFMPYTIQEKVYIIVFSSTLIYRSFSNFFGVVYQAAEKMQYNAILEILNRILFVPFAIALLYMGFGLPGLFGISIFSQLFTIVINFKLTKRFISYRFFNKINWDISILKPALIFSILSFTVILTTRIDIVMVSLLASSKDVGIYGVAYQITYTGVTVRTLLATAFFPIFVKTFYKKIVRWKKLLKYALLLGLSLLLLATVVSLLSTQIIPLLFGDEYFESGLILSVLIFYLAIVFFNIPFSNTIQATHNESKMLKVCWIGPSLNIGLNYLFYKQFGLIGIAYSTLVVGIVTLTIQIFITWRILKKQSKLS